MYAARNQNSVISEFDRLRIKAKKSVYFETEDYLIVCDAFAEKKTFFSTVYSGGVISHSFNYVNNFLFSEYKSIYGNSFDIIITDEVFEMNDETHQFVTKVKLDTKFVGLSPVPIMLSSQLIDNILYDTDMGLVKDDTMCYLFNVCVGDFFNASLISEFLCGFEITSETMANLLKVSVSKLFSMYYYNKLFDLIQHKSKNLCFFLKFLLIELMKNNILSCISIMFLISVGIAARDTKTTVKYFLSHYEESYKFNILQRYKKVNESVNELIVDKVIEKCIEEGYMKKRLRAITEEGISATIEDVEFKGTVKPMMIPTVFNKVKVLASPVKKQQYMSVFELFDTENKMHDEVDEWLGDAKLNYMIYKFLYAKTKNLKKCQVLAGRFRSNSFYQNYFNVFYGIPQLKTSDNFECIANRMDINDEKFSNVVSDMVDYGIKTEEVRQKEMDKLEKILSTKKEEYAESVVFIDYISEFAKFEKNFVIVSDYKEVDSKMTLSVSHQDIYYTLSYIFTASDKRDKKKLLYKRMLQILSIF